MQFLSPPIAASLLLSAIACGGHKGADQAATVDNVNRKPAARRIDAVAELKAASGQTIAGTIQLRETERGIHISGTLRNAPPGLHGLHFHERGDCSDIEGKSMGAHLAPDGHDHALPSESDQRHLGDLGNVNVSALGTAQVSTTIEEANLRRSDPHSLLNRALVIHSGEDLGRAKQPSGDSGTPIACAVVEPVRTP